MLLGNKRYNLFLPYFFHAEVDKKRLAIVLDPEAAFIYSKKLPSEGGGIWWHWAVFLDKDALPLTQGQEPNSI